MCLTDTLWRFFLQGEHKTDSEDLFYDPQDDWQKDLAVPATPSPVVSL